LVAARPARAWLSSEAPPPRQPKSKIDRRRMPRNTLKRLLPSPAWLRRNGSLDLLGEWVYATNLWHLNRYSASMAFFVGLFLAFVPIPGQMLLAAAGAVLLRCNLPLSVGLVLITNPITFPAIFFLAYQVGALIIDVPVRDVEFALTVEWFQHGLIRVWKPLLVGCLLCGLFFGSLGYFVVNVLWRLRVARQWRRRQRARKERTGPG
jgi:uncharacterized protein (DUF2062 family)